MNIWIEFAVEKIYKYFGKWIYLSQIFKYKNICQRLFWTNLAITIFCVFFCFVFLNHKLNHFWPLWTMLNHFWATMKIQIHRYCHRYWTNEYPNIFVSIWIYSAWKKLTNIKRNEYFRQNIFEYIWIPEYLSNTVVKTHLHKRRGG